MRTCIYTVCACPLSVSVSHLAIILNGQKKCIKKIILPQLFSHKQKRANCAAVDFHSIQDKQILLIGHALVGVKLASSPAKTSWFITPQCANLCADIEP